jgi:hypothetical protein
MKSLAKNREGFRQTIKNSHEILSHQQYLERKKIGITNSLYSQTGG